MAGYFLCWGLSRQPGAGVIATPTAPGSVGHQQTINRWLIRIHGQPAIGADVVLCDVINHRHLRCRAGH